jgi:hypothetical protein
MHTWGLFFCCACWLSEGLGSSLARPWSADQALAAFVGAEKGYKQAGVDACCVGELLCVNACYVATVTAAGSTAHMPAADVGLNHSAAICWC